MTIAAVARRTDRASHQVRQPCAWTVRSHVRAGKSTRRTAPPWYSPTRLATPCRVSNSSRPDNAGSPST